MMSEISIGRSEMDEILLEYEIEGVETVNDLEKKLENVNSNILNRWAEIQTKISIGEIDIIHEDDDCIVIKDNGDSIWGNSNSKMITLLHDVHKSIADKTLDTINLDDNGKVTYVHKTNAFKAGEQNMIYNISRFANEHETISTGIDRLITTRYNLNQTQWAEMTGRDQSTISRNVND